jgi:maltodextrin utilization protein YvdJ
MQREQDCATQKLLSFAAIMFVFLLITLAIVPYVKLLMVIIGVSGIVWVTKCL